MPHIYLIKDNDELVSHCRCDFALVSFPGQAACPWCGCGWLFSCISCRKAFAFARAVMIEIPLEELAKRDLEGGGFMDEIDDENRDAWVAGTRELLEKVVDGERYVYFDGAVIRADADRIHLSGWHAEHDLDFVPHTVALKDPSMRDGLLTNMDYWKKRAHRPPDAVVH